MGREEGEEGDGGGGWRGEESEMDSGKSFICVQTESPRRRQPYDAKVNVNNQPSLDLITE